MNHIVCDYSFFRRSVDRLGVGQRLCSFSGDIHYWNSVAGREEREELLNFLSGKVMEREEECAFSLLDKAIDRLSNLHMKDVFLSYAFSDYKWYSCLSGFGLIPIQVQVIRESVRVKRIFRGCRKDFGPYTKYTVSYRVRIHLADPIKDLTDQELMEPFKYDYLDFRKDGLHSWARAIKAVAQRPGRLFCSRKENFIVLLPQDLSEAERIFRLEFLKNKSFELSDVVMYGQCFAKSQEDCRNLAELGNKVPFFYYGGKMMTWDILGVPYTAHRSPSVKVRVPLLERGPHLFVKNCRRGLEVMGTCMDRWQKQGAIDKVSCKFGCFEVESFYSKNVSDSVEFVAQTIKFLSSAVNFVEFLMGNPVDSRSLREKLADMILEKVQLAPLDYCENPDSTISRLANFYVNGGY